MAGTNSTFLIVHGAWTGGWSWERVVQRLHARRHRAYVPTLTGLGERSHLAGQPIDLDTHIEDIVNEALFKDLSDITLVAHSYGGIVGVGAAERLAGRIASIVFIEALIPRDGMSFADFGIGDDFAEPLIPPPPSAPGDYLSEDDRMWVDAKATPQPVGTFTQKLRVTGAYLSVPRKTFIVATGWDGFEKIADGYRRDPAWTVREIAGGHDVAIDAPDELTEMLIDAAG